MSSNSAFRLAVLSFILLAAGTSSTAFGNMKVEKKLFQIGGPETRIRCINELKTKGVPKCKLMGFKVYCKDEWIKTCTEYATDLKQHEFFLVATGPDANQAIEKLLRDAIEKGLVAAVAAAEATPGEVAVRVSAAIAAFKVTLAAELSGKAALASAKDKYKLSLQERRHW